MRQQLVFAAVAAVTMGVMGMTALNTASAKGHDEEKHKEFKNVIFMIPDGCSQSIQTLARWYKGEALTLDSMNAGAVKTHMADSVITDSAAAATAFACAYKTSDGFVGVYPREEGLLSTIEEFDPYRAHAPLASILEAAKAEGKATGLVATSRITHATPAGFAAHIHDRNARDIIMEQEVYNGLTVAMGGGHRHLLPDEDTCPNGVEGGYRTDCENLEKVLLDRGYDVVTTKAAMDAVAVKPKTKLWGAFAMSHMDSDIDRTYLGLEEPSLAEMTAKAIEVLSQDHDGFFLMVEGSQVDWAGHNNDVIYMVTDFLAFDDAVKVAVDFAKADGDTLVVAFPDHNTGGMKIGSYYTEDNAIGARYTATKVEDLIAPLWGMQVTAEQITFMLGDYGDDLEAAIEDLWGLDVTEQDLEEIDALAPEVGLAYAIARVISKNHTVIGWTTHGHNGEDVPVWIYPQSAAIGVIDNTDLPALGQAGDLDALTEKLYIDVIQTAANSSLDLDQTLSLSVCVYRKSADKLHPMNIEYLLSRGDQAHSDFVLFVAPGGGIGADLDSKALVEDSLLIPPEPAKWHVADDQWMHLMLTYDGRRVRLYIDGREDKVKSMPGGLSKMDGPLNIGRMGNGQWQYGFNGKLDDLIIWKRALTEVEVRGLWATLVDGGSRRPAARDAGRQW
jgi:alkaline phosphatase